MGRISILMKWSQFSKEKKLISIHNPKTGGKTFASYLQTLFGKDLYFYRIVENKGKIHLGKLLTSHCIHGHLRYRDFIEVHEECIFVSWLRDPIQKVFSGYSHFKRGQAKKMGRAKQASLEELKYYLEGSFIQSDFIGSSLDAYTFVGITEYYAQSIELFRKMFQIEIPFHAELHTRNVNPSHQKALQGYGADVEVLELVKRNQVNEIALYAQAKEKFKKLCEAYGVKDGRADDEME